MKKILIILGALVVVILLAGFLVPILFKEDIKKAIDKELAANLEANAFYDVDQFSISLFRSFPDLSVSLGDFGLAGVGQFEGDTLIDVQRFMINLDIMSVIRGEEIIINDVLLEKPIIRILVLSDGSANYDIVKSSDSNEEESTASEGSDINISINNWEIVNADLVYYDQSLAFYTTLFGLNHQGTGDFSQEIFDMNSNTEVNQLSVGYDGVEYITNKSLKATVIMAMDLGAMKFTFKENTISLNDFGISLDGFISMPEEDIDIDLSYSGKDIDMKSVISLIPGLYQEYLDGVEASGQVTFDGFVKGQVTETGMPQVLANLMVSKGEIKYAEYPVPLEQINLNATFNYPSEDLRETTFEVRNFAMLLDGEPVAATLLFKDLEDYFWDLSLDGNIDLAKMTSIVPLEGVSISGKSKAKIRSSGRMSDLEAERYQKLTTEGDLSLTDFRYVSDDLPQGFGINVLNASFDPRQIRLVNYEGFAGKTDMKMSGSITNYMAYALQGDPLTGNLKFSSSLVDINEWMVSTDSLEAEVEDSTSLEVIRIPDNIDFVLASSIQELIYDNLSISDFQGSVIIRNGALLLENVNFDLLDGSFAMNGTYETTTEDPTFSYDLEIKELSIPSAFRAFTTVQRLAPFAEKMNGKFSTNFNISGALAQDMSPRLETLAGGGLLEILQASLAEVKLLSAVSTVSNLKQKDGNVTMKDVFMQTEIKDGRVYVQPFEMTMGGYKAEIAGSNSIDGKLDYLMTVKDVPTGAAGQALNAALSTLTGGKDVVASNVDINFGIGGDFLKPSVKLLGFNQAGSQQASTKSMLKTAAQEKVDAKKDEAKAQITDATTEVKEEATKAVEEKKEEVKEEAKEEIDKAKEKAEDALKGLLGKKKKKKDGGGNHK